VSAVASLLAIVLDVWLWVGILFGLVCYLAVPILVGPLLSAGKQQWLLRAYMGQAMTALDRGGLVDLEGAGFELVHWSYADGWNKLSLGDTEHRINDPGALMGRLHNRQFGFAREGVDKVLRPSTALVAEADKKATQTHGETAELMVQTQSGQQAVTGILGRVRVPETPQLVSFRHAPEFLSHSGDSRLPELTETYIKHSMSGYGSRDAVAMMAFVISGAAGAGLGWFFTQQGAGGSIDVTSSVPIMLDVLTTGVVG